jgi:hypothetical protein
MKNIYRSRRDMRTPYSNNNQAFSDAAHLCAREAIYPALFKCDPAALTFESVSVADGGRAEILDGEMAIDRLVSVKIPSLSGPLLFTVQERFRRVKFDGYTDLTITEYNAASKQLSELYKMTAGVFVYGFYDDKRDRFTKWLAADVNKMLHGIVTGELSYTKQTNGRSGQNFVGIEAAALFENGCLLSGTNKKKWGIK